MLEKRERRKKRRLNSQKHLHACISFELSGAISPVHTGTVVALFTIAKDIGDEHRAQNEQ